MAKDLQLRGVVETFHKNSPITLRINRQKKRAKRSLCLSHQAETEGQRGATRPAFPATLHPLPFHLLLLSLVQESK